MFGVYHIINLSQVVRGFTKKYNLSKDDLAQNKGENIAYWSW